MVDVEPMSQAQRSNIEVELRLLYRHPTDVVRRPGMWGRVLKDVERYRAFLAGGMAPGPAFLFAIRRGLDRLGFGLASWPWPEDFQTSRPIPIERLRAMQRVYVGIDHAIGGVA